MTILNKTYKKAFIDLSGPDGNAFALLGHARRFAKQIGMEQEDITALIEEMMGGDYENLIEIFDREFGSFCDLIR